MLNSLYGYLICLSCFVVCTSCVHKAQKPPAVYGAANANHAYPARLDAHVAPLVYDLTLHINPTKQDFSGSVDIAIQIFQPTQTIWLHGQDLRVKKATVLLHKQAMQAVYAQVTDEGLAKLQLPSTVGPGLATISIQFEADFNTHLEGLYKVHMDANDYIFSQFEPVAARRVFPCFDEPSFKTPFEVTLVVPDNMVAITNTEQLGEQVDLGQNANHQKTLVFKPTLPLPTYLIAFAVGPFDVVSAEDIAPNTYRTQPVALRGVAVHGRGDELGYALSHTGVLLQALEHYLGAPYLFEKLDIIAVPDFSAGAMENAGAITFRDWYLLSHLNQPDIAQKRGFTAVMAHELTHQWFGDSVTMPWWDDVWLNESFATWLEYHIATITNPDMHLDIDFLQGIQAAMFADSLHSARRIREPCYTNGDILNAFDSITYLKGGALLRMFEHYVGADAMQQGMQAYLEKYKLSHATSAQFIQTIEDTTHTPIAEAFDSFLNQPHVPLINVALHCDDTKSFLTAYQSVYQPLGATFDTAVSWQIPFCFRAGFGQDQTDKRCVMLTQKTTNIPLPSCPNWLMPNAQAVGYYYFDMPHVLLSKLEHAPLSVAERLSVADNAMAAFARGTLHADDVLHVLLPMVHTYDRPLITKPMEFFAFIHTYGIKNATQQLKFEQFLQNLYAPILQHLATPKAQEAHHKDDEITLLERHILSFLVTYSNDANILAHLASQGEAFLANQPVDPELIEIALIAALHVHGKPFFEKLQQHLHATNDTARRVDILNAIAAQHAPNMADAIHDLLLDKRLRRNERLRFFAKAMHQPKLRDMHWQWFKQHAEVIKSLLSENHLADLPNIARSFCSIASKKDVETFFTPWVATVPGLSRTLALTLESIDTCAAKIAIQQSSIDAMLEQSLR